MSYILFAAGEKAFIDTVLSAQAVSPAIPAPAGNWGLGLAATTGGVGLSSSLANKQRVIGTNIATTIAEIGQVAANGYARIAVARSNTGWPAATNASGADNYSSTAPQETFAFSDAPNLNGATLWFLAKSTTIATNDLMFGADLAAVRNFATGDTEAVTMTYHQA